MSKGSSTAYHLAIFCQGDVLTWYTEWGSEPITLRESHFRIIVKFMQHKQVSVEEKKVVSIINPKYKVAVHECTKYVSLKM